MHDMERPLVTLPLVLHPVFSPLLSGVPNDIYTTLLLLLDLHERNMSSFLLLPLAPGRRYRPLL